MPEPRMETCAKRVRVMLGGKVIADSRRALLVWEKPHYPTYYFPLADVGPEVLVETTRREGRIRYTVRAGELEVPDAAYADTTQEALREAVAFVWNEMDHWFEEDEEVYVHPRDPYKRVDVLRSSRHVRVYVDGVRVADSTSPTLLFETGLPVRYYLPKTDVRMDLLIPSDTRTACPYKGTAEYWSVEVNGRIHTDVAWSYPFPTIESAKIAGLVCFYSEKVAVEVDGLKVD